MFCQFYCPSDEKLYCKSHNLHKKWGQNISIRILKKRHMMHLGTRIFFFRNEREKERKREKGFRDYLSQILPWTSVYSPPEVTHSPHGLLHYTNCCTSPKTTFPIIHCTDDTQLISLITHHTRFISLELALCDRQVLFSVYPSDSYSTELSQ